MKQTIKYLSVAVHVTVGAMTLSCDKIDAGIEPQQKDNIVTLTATVGLDGGVQTRALTADGVKTFEVDETIAIVYKNTSGNTVKAVSAALTDADIASGNKSATFTFELSNPDKNQDVTYIYPAARANIDGTVNYDALAAQDGSLTTLAGNLDLATYTAAWNGNALPAGTLVNQLAILAITLKDNASPTANDITGTITEMTLNDGTNDYTVTRSAAAGPIYVAIRPTDSADITVNATSGSRSLIKLLSGKTYEAGNGYSISWKMSVEGRALSASAVGNLVGTDGLEYALGDRNYLPTGVSAAGMVAYKSGSNGLVIALTDDAIHGTDWNTAMGPSGASAHSPAVSGKTWRLPSFLEWQNMFEANGGEACDSEGLRISLPAAGGDALQEYYYWTSSEDVRFDGYAYIVEIHYEDDYFQVYYDDSYEINSNIPLVRACFDF